MQKITTRIMSHPDPKSVYLQSPLNASLMNAQSVCNKTNVFVTDSKPDFLLMTETWIRDHVSHICNQTTHEWYITKQISWNANRGVVQRYYVDHPTILRCLKHVNMNIRNLAPLHNNIALPEPKRGILKSQTTLCHLYPIPFEPLKFWLKDILRVVTPLLKMHRNRK